MSNQQKRKEAAIQRIESDVCSLDTNDLEYVGHALVKLDGGQPVIHRGLTRTGKPAGYTVDTFSSDRKTVGEYSTAAEFFEEPFDKFIGDVSHARSQAPDCSLLYLFSSRPCKESVWKKVPEVVHANFPELERFEVYDSRRIATEIYERAIGSNNLVEYFAGFLPSLWQMWTESLISHSTPPLPSDFVPDAARAETVQHTLSLHTRVAIRDISGSGKTYAAIEYAQREGEHFANTLWLAGDELASLTSLSAVRIKRLGVEVNLLSHLRTSACLLVIDDWKGSADALPQLLPQDLHPQTRILLTSIGNVGEGIHAIQLPTLARHSAEAILVVGVDVHPTPQQLEMICERAFFHPLTLAIIRDTVAESDASWDDIIGDLENLPQFEGSDQQTILQRVLLNRRRGDSRRTTATAVVGCPGS